MKKYIGKPFDIELAKAITSGEAEGRIRTKSGCPARIICFDAKSSFAHPLVALYDSNGEENVGFYTVDGKYLPYGESELDLILEVLKEVGEPEPGCGLKPFDQVLVRDEDDEKWSIELFDHFIPEFNIGKQPWFRCLSAAYYQCIPYEGNEHLHGTTDSPDEDVKAEEE